MANFHKQELFVELLGEHVVFMHEINTLPRFSHIINQVDGILKYDRATAISRQEDIVLLKTQPEKSYVDWLQKVGLGTGKIIVLNGNGNETLPERILNNGVKKKIERLLGEKKGKAALSPYYGGPLEKQASEQLGVEMYAETKAVQRFDSKINFKHLCRKIKVPVVKDVVFTARQGASVLGGLVSDMFAETKRAVVRGEFGASASTTYLFNKLDVAKLNNIVDTCQKNDRFLVEPFYNAFSSPSSVWFITKDKRIVHLRTSNQILDNGISHAGNEFPVSFDEECVKEFSLRIAKKLAEEGFIGPFGIDYIETHKGIFATECNPRMTGAIYPWELVTVLEQKGEIKAARAQNIHLPKKGVTFKRLMKAWKHLLYTGNNNQGVAIPFNVGPIGEGKVTVLCTGSSKQEVHELFEDLKRRLAVI